MSAYEMLSTLDEKVHPKNAALLVVDVQNDFCTRDGWWGQIGEEDGLAMGEKMLPHLKKLFAEARKAGVLIIFIQAIYDEKYQSFPMKEHFKRRLNSELPCRTGTWGADFWEVKPEERDIIVQKHRWSAFAGTDLDLVLRSHGIQTLIMTGGATNVCMGTTAHDGFFLDYYIVMPEDCSMSFSKELNDFALWVISRSFGEVVKSEDIISSWQRVK